MNVYLEIVTWKDAEGRVEALASIESTRLHDAQVFTTVYDWGYCLLRLGYVGNISAIVHVHFCPLYRLV